MKLATFARGDGSQALGAVVGDALLDLAGAAPGNPAFASMLALIAAVHGQWPLMFVWLGAALVIDGIDGTFARRLRVADVLTRWSGDVLDLVVDILNYVFVPAYAIAVSGLLPGSVATALGIIVVVTGALYFADRQMKTADSYFRGFPALWRWAFDRRRFARTILASRPGRACRPTTASKSRPTRRRPKRKRPRKASWRRPQRRREIDRTPKML